MKLPVASIKSLTLHDGPGIRTTIFVKGCPLRCIWCHNPETFSAAKQLIFHRDLCLNCTDCATVCTSNAHIFDSRSHNLDRDSCTSCGKCADVCLNGALEICGIEYDLDTLAERILSDKDFFGENGGVTVSGGEPLLYAGFVAEFFKIMKANDIHTALDTSGAADFKAFEAVLPYTDLVLYDVKGMNSQRHKENTSMSNELILNNLQKLSKYNIPIEIRMITVPGHNAFKEEFHAAGKFISQLDNISAVRLLPFHNMAQKKYTALDMKYRAVDITPPDHDIMTGFADILKQYLLIDVLY